MKNVLRAALPFVVLAVAALAMWALLSQEELPEVALPQQEYPLVRVVEAQPTTVVHRVRSQGTVRPLGQIDLIPEVGGKVLRVGPNLVAGAFFEEGELLLEVDARDYERAATIAETQVREAELAVLTEEARSRIVRAEWDELGDGAATELARREPQIRLAEARLGAARAALEQSRADLERTKTIAPYAGRVLSENVDVGQVLARGAPIAVLYRTDRAEIVIPIPDEDLAYLDLALFPKGQHGVDGPQVTLSAVFAGARRTWQGRVRRIEGQLDPRTRMVKLVAEVEDPYRGEEGASVPLPPGLFVEAEIEGRTVEEVFVLPRAAWYEGRVILVVGPEGRVDVRTPEIERRERDRIVVRSGLRAGERVIVSPIEVVVDGMRVEVMEGTNP